MLGVMRAQLVSPCVKHPDGDLTTSDVVLRRHRKRPSLEPSGQSAGSFFFFCVSLPPSCFSLMASFPSGRRSCSWRVLTRGRRSGRRTLLSAIWIWLEPPGGLQRPDTCERYSFDPKCRKQRGFGLACEETK